ncbi:MAG: FAD-dependent oxidoreductase [Anaerolineaceae bacterium]
MANPGIAEEPLRVAIVGAGPSAFYAADHLLKQPGLHVEVDMFDRLPTPYGLVRFGVAPDHQKIKTVTRSFAEIAANPHFRFYGCVEFGRDITLEEIRAHYHQVLFATGAQTDRRMGIPGEDLHGSHPATSFVAWYNGHPDYRDCQFDLSQERAVVVGVGNVAIDVARILCLTPDELVASDMAPHAVEALSRSRIREVHVLGRRGPAQAAFTTPEIKEFGALSDVDVIVRPEEAALDPLSQAFVEGANDRALSRKIELIQGYAAGTPSGRSRRAFFRFLVSPVELLDNGGGTVAGVRIVRNVLKGSGSGSLSAEPTGEFETIAAGLVFRSVGYRGVALPGVPFHDRWGVILNEHGRVLDPDSQTPITGEYVTGWIKRGPSGVIGTNKPDSVETVTAMLEDAAAARTFAPAAPGVAAAETMLHSQQPHYLTFEDWRQLDALELEAGARCGRPRVKFTSVDEMLAALGR